MKVHSQGMILSDDPIIVELLKDSIPDSMIRSRTRQIGFEESSEMRIRQDLIVLKCDFSCRHRTCINRFARFSLFRLPILIIRPVCFPGIIKGQGCFYVSLFNEFQLTSSQVVLIDKIRSSSLYADSFSLSYRFEIRINRILHVQKMILENHKRIRTVSNLAQSISVSPALLNCDFSRMSGITPGKLLRRIRMCTCLWELAATSNQIKGIAFDNGYDPAAFARSFREIFGIAPSEARRELLKQRGFISRA